MRSLSICSTLLSACCMLSETQAAPLDSLTTADTGLNRGEFRTDIGFDTMNHTLDFLHLQSGQGVSSDTGNYSGIHLGLEVAVSDAWVVQFIYQDRFKLVYNRDNETVKSWQVAAKYRLTQDRNAAAQFSARLGAWGDYSNALVNNRQETINDWTLNDIVISKPHDRQVQLDMIGAFKLPADLALNTFASVGHSIVSGGQESAYHNNCNYSFTFGLKGVYGELSSPPACGGTAPLLVNFSASNVLEDMSYTAIYGELGGLMQWHPDNSRFTIRGGYQFETLNRDRVDGVVAGNHHQPYKTNHILLGETVVNVTEGSAMYLRGQLMMHQYAGEIPMLYDSFTAKGFNLKSGLFSIGLYSRF